MTMRFMTMFGLVIGLACAVPFGGAADAQTYTRIKCIADTRLVVRPVSTPVTWICKASEKCCYDYLARKGTCIAASSRCW
jgi:hypothetical protein